jgi:hypothetical protein
MTLLHEMLRYGVFHTIDWRLDSFGFGISSYASSTQEMLILLLLRTKFSLACRRLLPLYEGAMTPY